MSRLWVGTLLVLAAGCADTPHATVPPAASIDGIKKSRMCATFACKWEDPVELPDRRPGRDSLAYVASVGNPETTLTVFTAANGRIVSAQLAYKHPEREHDLAKAWLLAFAGSVDGAAAERLGHQLDGSQALCTAPWAEVGRFSLRTGRSPAGPTMVSVLVEIGDESDTAGDCLAGT